jgi:NADH-quinone oxidoreductase subunit N
VFFSIIGLFYYLRIIKLMYFDEQTDPAPLQCSMDMRFVLSGNALMILALGIYPASLMALCISVFA